jgi:hypothetical protein
MDYYKVPMLSNSYLGELDRLVNDKFMPSEEVLQKAFYVGNQVDYSLFEQDKLDSTNPELESILQMRDAVMKHPLFQAYYKHPQAKHQHEVYRLIQGVPIKGKLDSWIKPIKTFCEFKTTACLTLDAFVKLAFGTLNYDRQIATYMQLTKADTCILVAVSKKNHKVFSYIVKRGDNTYKQGLQKLNEALKLYLEYQEFSNFEYPRFSNNGNIPIPLSTAY